jgi:P27 family predicted phage terminase small subunit
LELAAWSDLSGPLLKMKVLTEADGIVLELAAVELAAYREAHRHLAEEGIVVEGKLNPWYLAREGAWKKLFRMLAACGMTPADRTKVSVVGDGAADPFEEFLQS